MFLVSGPELVIAACRAGVIGAFPTVSAKPLAVLVEWLGRIARETRAAERERPGSVAPWAANLNVHRSYERFVDDLRLVLEHEPPAAISALGSPARVIDDVHAYGGFVFAISGAIGGLRSCSRSRIGVKMGCELRARRSPASRRVREEGPSASDICS
jgi:nitronate monooxygenase